MSAATQTACVRLVAALPAKVSDQPRRPANDSSGTTAAWGDPAITLRCGVGRPSGFTATSPCQSTDGIDWYVPISAIEDQSADVELTTVGRFPAVAVHLPASYRPPVAVMVDLTHAIKTHTKLLRRCR
ncbi:MAG: DUF3515 domain-containing protein [Actinomycetota bacterium]|nr:DUF3515 domain-containing protein [Actinomycetota bacterium]